jgi:hypothetical protein
MKAATPFQPMKAATPFQPMKAATPFQPMKAATPFQPTLLTVTKKKGSMITAQRGEQLVTRNSSFFKPSPRHPNAAETEPDTPDTVDEAENQAASQNPHARNSDRTDAHDTQNLRRSSRSVRPPKRFQDFVM